MQAPHQPSLVSPTPGVSLRRVDLGTGVTLRIAEAGPSDGTMVVMLHGFPETWFSWRHQLRALGDAGFLAVAPDTRGYAGSDAPKEVADYSVHSIAADVLGLLRLHGRSQAYLVGHDMGASLTWYLARMHPEHFPAICVLSVPDVLAQKFPPLAGMKKLFGDYDNPKQRFFYVLYHNEYSGQGGPAEAEYDADPRFSLFKFYTDGSVPKDKPRITKKGRVAGGMLGRLPTPRALPSWLPEADFDYLVEQFSSPTGQSFRGGVNYYRNQTRDFLLSQHIVGKPVQQPTLFIAGADDGVITMFGGRQRAEENLKQSAPNLRKAVFLEGCGHWVQQEKADETNAELVAFFKNLPPLRPASSRL